VGRKSRTKGAAAEREVVSLLRPVWPAVARELEQVRTSCGRDLSGTAPFAVQIKRRANITPAVIGSAIREAGRECSSDGPYRCPVAFYRSDRQPWRVAMYLKDLAEMFGGVVNGNGTFMDCSTLIVHMLAESWRDIAASWRAVSQEGDINDSRRLNEHAQPGARHL